MLFVNFRLRDSRLGRAWIAIREDEVAAVSMGVPLVKTKLFAYSAGAACGGVSGAFLGSYLNVVNADQFEFSFSIFVLAMIILGGLGSIWGVVVGALILSFINTRLIPDVLNNVPGKLGLDFDLTQLGFGIFGFLLVIMMILRPQGLIPERRRSHRADRGHRQRRGALRGAGMTEDQRPPEGAEPEPIVSDHEPGPGHFNPIHDVSAGEMGGALLRALNVSKIFGGLVAVSDVSFSIPPRSIVSIIGPNGAGKTTFFNMLTGLYKPSLGRIDFDGHDITAGRPDKITALGMARTFQNIRLFGTMSALENVLVGQHARMKAGVFGSIFRTPGCAGRSAGCARRRARCSPTSACGPRRSTSSRSTSPTATSAAWRSPARSRPTRSCCCSTSPRPA